MEKEREWTTEDLAAFKAAYQKAADSEKKVFIFNGDEVFTAYAKYLIQYLEGLS